MKAEMLGMFYLNILTDMGLKISATELRHECTDTDICIKMYENICNDFTEEITKTSTISHGYLATSFSPDERNTEEKK